MPRISERAMSQRLTELERRVLVEAARSGAWYLRQPGFLKMLGVSRVEVFEAFGRALRKVENDGS